MSLDRGIFLPQTTLPEGGMPLSKWQSDHLRDQKRALDKAKTIQRQKDTEHIGSYPMPGPTDFKIGSYVLIEYPTDAIRRGPANKLLTMLKGPYKIVKKEGNTFVVHNSNSKRDETCHVMQLHPFLYDERYDAPADIAMRDMVSLFKTQAIVEHKGDSRRKAELFFKVRWQGYGAEYDTWEPWKSLIHNEHLHKYLFDTEGMRHLIPAEDRTGEFQTVRKRKNGSP